MIAEGKLAGCFEHGKINRDKALEKLKLRTDAGQRVGRWPDKVQASPNLFADRPEIDEIDLNLKVERLEQEKAKTRRALEEEAARKGFYVLASDAATEGGKVASTILQMFEGGLTGMAGEIAQAFKIPERDVKHMLRRRFRALRTDVSAALAKAALAVPETVDAPDLDAE